MSKMKAGNYLLVLASAQEVLVFGKKERCKKIMRIPDKVDAKTFAAKKAKKRGLRLAECPSSREFRLKKNRK